jgi:hypothetical protein
LERIVLELRKIDMPTKDKPKHPPLQQQHPSGADKRLEEKKAQQQSQTHQM